MFKSTTKTSEDARYLNNERILEELSRNTNPFLNENNDGKLSDDTYRYLQKKLSEANESLTTYIQREGSLTRDLDRLRDENQDLKCQNLKLQSEVEAFRTQQVTIEQKLVSYNRTIITMQEKTKTLEKYLDDEREKLKICKAKLQEAESKMIGTDSIAKQMYNVASNSFAQSDKMRDEVRSLESLIGTCKKAMTKLSEEKQDISSKLSVIEKDYENYEGTLEDALTDIEILKEESRKQETYINDTLNRFKEINIHFESMKQYVTHQQEKLQSCQQELASRTEEESKIKKELEMKSAEVISLKDSYYSRESDLTLNISQLEQKTNLLDATRNDLESKNKSMEKEMQDNYEEKIKIQSKIESLQMLLEGENKRCLEMKSLFDEEKDQREQCQKQLNETVGKIHVLELKVAEETGARHKSEEIICNLKNENTKQSNLIATQDKELKEANEEQLELKNNLVRTQNQIQTLQDNVVSVEGCFKERYSEYTKLQQSFQQISICKENLQTELDEKNMKLDTVGRSCTEQERKIRTLEEKLNQCQILFMQNEEKYCSAANKVKQLQQINNEKEAMNDKACEMVSEMQAAREAEARNKRNILERLRDLQEEFDKYKLNSENEKSRMIEEAKRIRMVVQGDGEEREIQKKAHEEAIFALNNKLKEMADIIDTDREQIVKLQDRIAFLSSKSDKWLQETSDLNDKISEKETLIRNCETEKQDLTKDLKVYQDEVKNVQLELKEKTQDFENYKKEVKAFEKLWHHQQTQALKELQAELSSHSNYSATDDNHEILLAGNSEVKQTKIYDANVCSALNCYGIQISDGQSNVYLRCQQLLGEKFLCTMMLEKFEARFLICIERKQLLKS